jgi:hypothetical protein
MALRGGLQVVAFAALALVIAQVAGFDLWGWLVGVAEATVTGVLDWIVGGVTDTLSPW